MGRPDVQRVLIADSDPQLRDLLFTALLAVDVFSDCVSSVPDALNKLGDESYGVVLIDIGLQGGSAEDVVNRIAHLHRDRRPVVLVVAANPATARSLDIDIVQIVLRKPLALRSTVGLIKSCVQSTSARPRVQDAEADHATS